MLWSLLRANLRRLLAIFNHLIEYLGIYLFINKLTANAIIQDKGLAAMERLDRVAGRVQQAAGGQGQAGGGPSSSRRALGFVGAVEEAMVKGFPYDVPAQYSSLPQLKVRLSRVCQRACRLHADRMRLPMSGEQMEALP